MGLFQTASDDQIALAACAIAFALSAGLMYFSYFIGQPGRRGSGAEAAVPERIRLSRTTAAGGRRRAGSDSRGRAA